MKRIFECVFIMLRFYITPKYWKKHFLRVINRNIWLLGAIWLLISLIDFFFKESSPIPQNPNVFWMVFFTSALIATLLTLPILSVSERIKGKDISITIVVGDIFKQKGDLIIATNSTFDTTFEDDFISTKSIQGQLTEREYDKIDHLDQEIAIQLNNYKPVKEHNRRSSKNKQYEIGTIVKLNHRSGFKSYWVALADVNEHGKPNGQFENLQICLEALWRYVSKKGHMTRLVMPIIGSGKTGINENRFKILQETIFSFVGANLTEKKNKFTEELVICILPNDIISEKLDIDELKEYLNYQCKYRYDSMDGRSTSKETN